MDESTRTRSVKVHRRSLSFDLHHEQKSFCPLYLRGIDLTDRRTTRFILEHFISTLLEPWLAHRRLRARVRHRNSERSDCRGCLRSRPLAEAFDEFADVSTTIFNLTWNRNRDRITPNPSESTDEPIVRVAVTYRPRKFSRMIGHHPAVGPWLFHFPDATTAVPF